MILVVAVIAIVAALWISVKNDFIVTAFKNKAIEGDFIELKLAKDRLLQLSVLAPEIYPFDKDNAIPPGVFPCPDTPASSDVSRSEVNVFSSANGYSGEEDGSSDPIWTCSTGTSDPIVLWGMLPQYIIDKDFDPLITPILDNVDFILGEAKKFFYFVDERYVVGNSGYPGMVNKLLTPDILVNADEGLGMITLNGVGGVIAIIADPGEDGVFNEFSVNDYINFTYEVDNAATASSDPNIDKVVAISYQSEWLPLIARRVCREISKLTNTYPDLDDDDVLDPVYTGYFGDLDSWQTSQSWFYRDGNDGDEDNWFGWSAVCQ
ncbi:putative Type 4 fimbrial biogenesis protein PilX N-terminal domain-containing protein [uncultured Thiomicrorhabdus sp.]